MSQQVCLLNGKVVIVVHKIIMLLHCREVPLIYMTAIVQEGAPDKMLVLYLRTALQCEQGGYTICCLVLDQPLSLFSSHGQEESTTVTMITLSPVHITLTKCTSELHTIV